MEQQLQIIIYKLSILETDINKIKESLYEIKQDTNKMDKHIDFVDNIYDKVKSPFHYILDSVDKVRGIVPQIKD